MYRRTIYSKYINIVLIHYRMERFYLAVQQAVFLDGCVAVNGPNQAVRVLPSLIVLFAKHGWSWPPVDLNVSP